MAYTIEQQYSRDIDWYFKDNNNNLVHVASGGGRLPKRIEENDELMNILHTLVLSFEPQFEVSINPNLEQYVSFENEQSRNLYLEDFIEMARRGLISIDKTLLGNFEDPTYHIVAYPKNKKGKRYDNEFISSTKELDINNSMKVNIMDLFE